MICIDCQECVIYWFLENKYVLAWIYEDRLQSATMNTNKDIDFLHIGTTLILRSNTLNPNKRMLYSKEIEVVSTDSPEWWNQIPLKLRVKYCGLSEGTIRDIQKDVLLTPYFKLLPSKQKKLTITFEGKKLTYPCCPRAKCCKKSRKEREMTVGEAFEKNITFFLDDAEIEPNLCFDLARIDQDLPICQYCKRACWPEQIYFIRATIQESDLEQERAKKEKPVQKFTDSTDIKCFFQRKRRKEEIKNESIFKPMKDDQIYPSLIQSSRSLHVVSFGNNATKILFEDLKLNNSFDVLSQLLTKTAKKAISPIVSIYEKRGERTYSLYQLDVVVESRESKTDNFWQKFKIK